MTRPSASKTDTGVQCQMVHPITSGVSTPASRSVALDRHHILQSPCTSICTFRSSVRPRYRRYSQGRLATAERQHAKASASSEVEAETPNASSSSAADGPADTDVTIRRTIGNLDALLGIEEDEKGKPVIKDESKVRSRPHILQLLSPGAVLS